MASESTATTTWEGSLEKGRGEASTASGTISNVEVSWPARVSRTKDTTSPEELLAASHAACYCMGLTHELGETGHTPDRLEATVRVTFVPGEGVKSSHIEVSGRVEGLDADGFQQAAQAAAKNCPISGALKGNVEITVEASLNQ
jgi:osmotically inducible protein OsmC